MTRDDWCAYIESVPPTPNQLGAIVGAFERLGVVDRAERLAISAELLGLEELGSTTDLVMGDAGRLVGMLRRTSDRAGLPNVTAAAADGDQADEHDDDGQDGNERITWPVAVTRIMIMIWAASRGIQPESRTAEGAHELCGQIARPCARRECERGQEGRAATGRP